jgi:hypothetical protein
MSPNTIANDDLCPPIKNRVSNDYIHLSPGPCIRLINTVIVNAGFNTP